MDGSNHLGKIIVRRGTEYALLFFILSAACFLVVALCFIMPFFNESGLLLHLDGSSWKMDHQSLWDTLGPVSAVVYSLGDLGCHQEQARTLILNNNEMALCIRDTFLFIGLGAGFLFCGLGLDLREKPVLIGLILVILTPIEWSFEHYLDLGNAFARALVSLVSAFGATIVINAILRWESAFFDDLAARKRRD